MRLLIDGAMVWDGTGAKPFAGKVLIEGERIAAVAPQAENCCIRRRRAPRCRPANS